MQHTAAVLERSQMALGITMAYCGFWLGSMSQPMEKDKKRQQKLISFPNLMFQINWNLKGKAGMRAEKFRVISLSGGSKSDDSVTTSILSMRSGWGKNTMEQLSLVSRNKYKRTVN